MDSQKKNSEKLYQPSGRGRYQDRRGKSFGERKFQSREGGREREDRFRSSRDSFRSNDDKFQNRRDFRDKDKFRGREDNRFKKDFRDKKTGFQPKGKFQPRGKFSKPFEKERPPKIYDEMQITDGKLRGKFLKSTLSPKIRPTARRIREVFFRLLYRRIRFSRFLDLCAGSGAMGLEAISRGALIATFVERSGKMCSFIKKNMESCSIKAGHGEVFEIEVMPFLKRAAKSKRKWDVIYFDPPYDANYDEVLELLGRGIAIESKGTLVIEHHAEMFFPEKIGCLRRWKVIINGETGMSFYERVN